MAFLSQEPLIELKVLSEKTFLLPRYTFSLLFLVKQQSKKYVIEWWFCGQVNLKPVHEIEDVFKKLIWGQAFLSHEEIL